MAFNKLFALCKRTGVLDVLRNVVDTADQLPVTIILTFFRQRLVFCNRIEAPLLSVIALPRVSPL